MLQIPPSSLSFLDCKDFNSTNSTDREDGLDDTEQFGEINPGYLAHPTFSIPAVADVRHLYPYSQIEPNQILLTLTARSLRYDFEIVKELC
jgi:hypothetical protein